MVNGATKEDSLHLSESEGQHDGASRMILESVAGLVKQTQRQTNIITIQSLVIAGLVVSVVSLSFKVWTIHYTNAYGGIQTSTVGQIDELS